MKKMRLALILASLGAGLASCSNALPATAEDFRKAQEAEYGHGNRTYRLTGNVSENTYLDGARIEQVKVTAIDGNLSVKKLPKHLSGFTLDYVKKNDFFFEGGCTSFEISNTENLDRKTDLKASNPRISAYLYRNDGYFDWSQTNLENAILNGQSIAEYGKQWVIRNFIDDTFKLPDYSEEVFDTYVNAMFKYQRSGDGNTATFNLDYERACDVFTAVRLAVWAGENGINPQNVRDNPELTPRRNLFRQEIEAVLGEDFALNLVFDYVPEGIRAIRFNLGGKIRPEANNYDLDENQIKTYEFNVDLTLESVNARPIPAQAPGGYHDVPRH